MNHATPAAFYAHQESRNNYYEIGLELIDSGFEYFAGKNGFQAILSFVITILTIWKVLVPCYLKGYSPVWIGIIITFALTVVIIFFVYGFDKRTLTASLGSLLGGYNNMHSLHKIYRFI